MKENISIIICCYNSVNRIEPTLNHIASQQLQGLIAEIILVDNNCSDDTVKYAKKIWELYGKPFPMKVVFENKPGLSFARKAGVMSAKGEIIVFCDDDNWLESEYCSKAFNILKKFPDIGVLGGRSEAVSNIDFPFWFSSFQGNYAVGVQDLISGYIGNRGYLWGAGMVVRTGEIKRLYESGFKSILTGRKGISLSSGEDTEICKWYLLVGKRLYYSEDLVLKHFIDFNRLSLDYLINLRKAINEAGEVIFFYNTYIFLKFNIKLNLLTMLRPILKFLIGKANIQDRIQLQLFNISFFKFEQDIINLERSINKFHNN